VSFVVSKLTHERPRPCPIDVDLFMHNLLMKVAFED
jgi:hypothetical protein